MADCLRALESGPAAFHALKDAPLATLLSAANALRERGHGARISYSRKVFLPVTHLCRDTCRYCTFAKPPRRGQQIYMREAEVLDVARKGAAMGCREALFTLGDNPEARWKESREALDELGFASTMDYVAHLAKRVIEETGLLPHLNPGLMDGARMAELRAVSPSMGLMLESISPRLMERGGPHYGCPDKEPVARLKTIEAAGRTRTPFTTGLLIGIGETREERIEALEALYDLHAQYGHIQEIIIQPFRAKPRTRMHDAPEPSEDELLWTLAAARIIMGPGANIQTPPNLSPDGLQHLIEAGVNDLGGISPLTPDFVNPEAPWPHLGALATHLAEHGYELAERLTIYPEYAAAPDRWLHPAIAPRIRVATDGAGWPREDDWITGQSREAPDWAKLADQAQPRRSSVATVLARVQSDARPSEADIAALFDARGGDYRDVCNAADAQRRQQNGDTVSYVVTRNINYTNVCTYSCGFCAFSKGRVAPELRSAPYEVEYAEISRRAAEAWDRGGTEVCLQGGIHPSYDGQTYLDILAAAKAGAPNIHVHAFSPLEIMHGAGARGISVRDYLQELKAAGLGSVPGTAAEILDDEARALLCPDKLTADEWISVMRDAHSVGLKSTSTIMFGHVDNYTQWARHLLRLRDLAEETGGFTEFVPLPFVADEAPMHRKGKSRRGPTFREAVLMHAVARLVLGRFIPNIQTSWVKMGPEGALHCLNAGANDIGGTLMNETITRSAGAQHGQERPPLEMEALIASAGRTPRLRTTLYADAPNERRETAIRAPELLPIQQTPAARRKRQAARAET